MSQRGLDSVGCGEESDRRRRACWEAALIARFRWGLSAGRGNGGGGGAGSE